MKRTPWYPMTIAPARDGVYEVDLVGMATIQRIRFTMRHGWAKPWVARCDYWRGLTRKAK